MKITTANHRPRPAKGSHVQITNATFQHGKEVQPLTLISPEPARKTQCKPAHSVTDPGAVDPAD